MIPDQALHRRIVETVATRIAAHASELTALDQAIGDGDHGLNMARGFGAVQESLATLCDQPTAAMLMEIGKTLVMRVGGASGPLYGTLFLELGRQWPETPSRAGIAAALKAALAVVRARGKSEPGQKTMLDVLTPVALALADTAAIPDEALLARLRSIAKASADATVPMKAIRGRASFLGDRSIGHMDPGARSSALMIEAICETLESRV